MKLEESRIRSFKCLVRSYYDLQRLKHDLTLDELRIMCKTFYDGGFDMIYTSRNKSNLPPSHKLYINELKISSDTDFVDKRMLSAALKIRLSKVSFGYRSVNKSIVRHSPDSTFVYIAFIAFVKNKSISKVLNYLRALGANNFDWDILYNLLTNCFYAGLLKFNGRYYCRKDDIPAIISPQIFFEVQEILKPSSKTKDDLKCYQLNRFVRNVHDGMYYVGYRRRKKSGKQFHYYKCAATEQPYNIKAETLESHLNDFFLSNTEALLKSVPEQFFDTVHDLFYPHLEKLISIVKAKHNGIDKTGRIKLAQSEGKVASKVTVLKRLVRDLEYFSDKDRFLEFSQTLVNQIDNTWKESDQKLRREIQFTIFPFGVDFDFNENRFKNILAIGQQCSSLNRFRPSQNLLFG